MRTRAQRSVYAFSPPSLSHSDCTYKMEKLENPTRKKLCLSRRDEARKEQANVPEGLYNRDIKFPPGIASNCYASSVLQCLFSTTTFNLLLDAVAAAHSQDCVTCNAVAGILTPCINYKLIIKCVVGTHCNPAAVSALQQQYIYKEFGSHLIPLQFVQSLRGDNHYTNENVPVIIIIIIIVTDIHPQLVESEQQDAHEFLILFIGYLLSKLPSR